MAFKSKHFMFRSLTDKEEVEFRKDARKNYNAGDDIKGVWHPVYRDECMKMVLELTREEETVAVYRPASLFSGPYTCLECYTDYKTQEEVMGHIAEHHVEGAYRGSDS